MFSSASGRRTKRLISLHLFVSMLSLLLVDVCECVEFFFFFYITYSLMCYQEGRPLVLTWTPSPATVVTLTEAIAVTAAATITLTRRTARGVTAAMKASVRMMGRVVDAGSEGGNEMDAAVTKAAPGGVTKAVLGAATKAVPGAVTKAAPGAAEMAAVGGWVPLKGKIEVIVSHTQ